MNMLSFCLILSSSKLIEVNCLPQITGFCNSTVIVHSFDNILSQVSPVQGRLSFNVSVGLRTFQPKLSPMDIDCSSETYYVIEPI